MLKIGTLPTTIAVELNNNNIPMPSETVGNNHTRKYGAIKSTWNRNTILRIARDKTYLGHVVNGKIKKVSYKSKKMLKIAPEDYIEVKGMHEALVDQDTFDTVQRMIASRRRTRVYKHEFLLKGLLECAECGNKLSVITQRRKDGSPRQYLRCNTYATMTRLKLCTPHSNNCDVLTEKILKTIKTRLKNFLKEDELYAIANKVKDSSVYTKQLLQNQILSTKGKIELMNKKIDQLYEDRLQNIISVDDFERMYTATLDKKKEIEQLLNQLQIQKENRNEEIDLKNAIKEFINTKEITREMIVSLVDKITVSEKKEVKIYYKFNILNQKTKKKSSEKTLKTA